METVDELCQELNGILDILCSAAQQKFCVDHHIATTPQLQRIRQTVQQAQRFAPIVGLVGGPNSDRLRQTFYDTVYEFEELLGAACRQRHIRPLTDSATQQLLSDWNKATQIYDDKVKENVAVAQLVEDVTSLRKAWKKLDPVESIVTSVLASGEVLDGMYVVTVDRQNYAQLGLGLKSLHSRQIVFECSKFNHSRQIDAVTQICQRFAALFMQNAHHNLSQIEAQARLARATGLARRLERVQEQLFAAKTDGSLSDNEIVPRIDSESSGDDGDHEEQQQVIDSRVMYRLEAHQATSNSVPPPRFISYPTDNANTSIPIIDLPFPSFTPAPWQWADLLKPRWPFQPLLFGLIKKRRTLSESKRNFVTLQSQQGPVDRSADLARYNDLEVANQQVEPALSTFTECGSAQFQNAPFTTVSVMQLCTHLCRVGYQFYENVANNARLRYRQDSQILQGIGQDLVHIHACLQLEQLRSMGERALAVLQQLAAIQPPQQLLASRTAQQSSVVEQQSPEEKDTVPTLLQSTSSAAPSSL